MNRRKIIEILFSTLKYTQDQKDIIIELEEAKLEWENAKRYFEMAEDPMLVDYAIYREDQSKAK